MSITMNDVTPWYKQFWPWFLISLPLTAVIASFITLNFAITDTDGLVKDDYYKEGLAVNLDLARQKYAKELGVEAQVNFDHTGKLLELTFNDAAIGKVDVINVDLIHPTRAHQDMSLQLHSNDGKFFTIELPEIVSPGYWWVRVSPTNNSWNIEGRIHLPEETILTVK